MSFVERLESRELLSAVNISHGAIIVTHGECDAGNANYETDLYQLWTDYNADLPAITGQTQRIQMIASQQQSTNDRAASTLAQWRIGVDHPTDVVLAGIRHTAS